MKYKYLKNVHASQLACDISINQQKPVRVLLYQVLDIFSFLLFNHEIYSS